MLKPTKILVPSDFSKHSTKALKQAVDIARQYGAKIVLLHVITHLTQQCVIDYCLSLEEVTALDNRMMEEARNKLREQAQGVATAEQVPVEIAVRKGVAYDEILKEEKEKGIDLIVIASLGTTALLHNLIGSVARNVLRGSKVPVLLTK